MFQQLNNATTAVNSFVVYPLLAKEQSEYSNEEAEQLGQIMSEQAKEFPLLYLDTIISMLDRWGFGLSDSYDAQRMEEIYQIAFANHGYATDFNDLIRILQGVRAAYVFEPEAHSFERVKSLYEQMIPNLTAAKDPYLVLATKRLFLNIVLGFSFTDDVQAFLKDLAMALNTADEEMLANASNIATSMIRQPG